MCSGTRRGSSHEPPKSSERPRLVKISEKRAFVLATTRSQPRARLHPAPTATPRTLAIVGCGNLCKARATSPTERICASPCGGGPSSAPCHRSAPAQNSPPAPVMITTRSAVLPAISLKVSRSSLHICRVAAFFLAGRLSMTVTTPSRRVTSIVSMNGDDTESMGYNPHRKMVRKRGDLLFVVAAIVVAVVLLVWAFLG